MKLLTTALLLLTLNQAFAGSGGIDSSGDERPPVNVNELRCQEIGEERGASRSFFALRKNRDGSYRALVNVATTAEDIAGTAKVLAENLSCNFARVDASLFRCTMEGGTISSERLDRTELNAIGRVSVRSGHKITAVGVAFQDKTPDSLPVLALEFGIHTPGRCVVNPATTNN